MPKIGIIFALHNLSSKEFEDVMAPWIKFKGKNPSTIFSCVSYTFDENRKDNFSLEANAKTIDMIEKSNYFSYVFSDKDYNGESLQEAGVRDKALQFLLREICDVIWLWDGDEFAQEHELTNILSFINRFSDYAWYSTCYKNYVFDEHTYLEEPFTPPRIFRAEYRGAKIDKFYLDNDISYFSAEEKLISFHQLPFKKIPKTIAFIKHLSWLSNERSKRKITYQKAHFGKYGGGCSYDWDEKNDRLIFNLDFYAKRGDNVPKLIHEKN